MPRYEYSEGTSNKFWEIELAGSKYTAKWGKIGGSTSMSTKDCGSAAGAQKAYDKLIAEKTGKGYQLVGGKAAKSVVKPAADGKAKRKVVTVDAVPAGPARNADLEKAMLANPDDKDAYLVYADWLQGQGEIRGELIVLQAAGKTKEANALIRKYSDWFFGPFGGKKKPLIFKIDWQYGYIKSAEIGWENFADGGYDDEESEDAEELDADGWAEAVEKRMIEFLQHPSARFIQRLQLGPIPGEEEMSLTPFADAIDEVKPACLRELYLGETGDWDLSSTSTKAPQSKSIKGLRILHLHGGNVGIGKLELPELREFKVMSGGLSNRDLKDVAAGKWPKLEKLEVYCGDPRYGGSGSAKDLAPIFAGTGLKHVKHLGVMNCAFADEAVKQLIKSKILPQLTTLDLSFGNLSDKGIDAMVASNAFKHLAMLELDDNALTEVSKPKVKGLAKKVNYGTQDSPERAVPRTEENKWYRYTAIGE